MIGTSRAEYILIRTSVFLLHYAPALTLTVLIILQLTTRALSPPSSWRGGGVPDGDGDDASSPYKPPAAARIAALALASLLLADGLFALAVYLPFRRHARRVLARYPEPALTAQERRALFAKCIDNVPDVEAYVRGWFMGAELRDVRRENVREFLGWAFFDRDCSATSAPTDGAAVGGQRHRHGLTAEEEEEMDGYLDAIDRLLVENGGGGSGCGLEAGLRPGRGPAQGGLRLTIDDVEMQFRSVVWYLIVMTVDVYTHASMLWRGFQYRAAASRKQNLVVFPPRPQLLLPNSSSSSPSAALGYWYRPHTARGKKPVLFLHGIGIGLLPYRDFLSEIAGGIREEDEEEDGGGGDGGGGQIGIIAVELLPLSMRFAGYPLDHDAFVAHITAILAHHGWLDLPQGFVLATHSYGSVLATHMLRTQHLAPRIAAAVLTDPVTLLLHLPNVAYNFTRRPPRHANEWQLWFFASTDPSTALALGRHFFWQKNEVWKEELLRRPSDVDVAADESPRRHHPDGAVIDDGGAGRQQQRKRKVAVSLAGRDIIVDAGHVAQYLACGEGEGGSIAHPTPEDKESYRQLMLHAAVATEADNPQRHHHHRHRSVMGGWFGRTAAENGAATAPATTAVKKGEGYLTRSGIEVMYFPTLDHAQVFDAKAERRRVVRVVRRYCR